MKTITIILLSLISTLGFSQSDSITAYQYRISIKDVTNKGSAKLVQEPMTDVFKTIPTYQENLNTFIFESKEDVKQYDLITILPASYNNITYFKKCVIKVDTLK